jgi:hypothetical protein
MANYRLEGSIMSIPSQLQLFAPLQCPAGVEKVFWTDHNPVSAISGNNSIDFTISPNGSHYTDLKRTKLCVQCKITKPDGSNIDDEQNVTFKNNALSILFSQVDVFFQQQLVSSATNYPYHSYFYNLLNYGGSASKSQLQLQLFYKDDAGSFDSARVHPQGHPLNTGAQSRMQLTRGGKIVDLEGPIFASICNCDKYILNGVEIKIKLQQSRNEFRLMASDKVEYKVEILNIFFKVCKVAVTSSIIAGHDIALSKSNAIYNFTKNEIKSYTISKGTYNYSVEDFFNGDVPSRLLVGFLSSEAYNGSYILSPYNFKHYYASYLAVTVDGQTTPSRGLQPIYHEAVGEPPIVHGNYTEAYQTLFSGLDKLGRDQGLIFTRLEYPRGYTLYLFDLDAAISAEGEYPLIRKGNMKFECRFSKSLPDTVNVIFLGEFGGIFEIDQARNILLN